MIIIILLLLIIIIIINIIYLILYLFIKKFFIIIIKNKIIKKNKNKKREALAVKEKLKEIFLYYPLLLQFCLWYYTPTCYRGIHAKKKKRQKHHHYLNNILESIAQYIPPNSPVLNNYPKIRLSSQPNADYQQLNLIQQWINKIYYQPDHHCSQCQSWYSLQSLNPRKAFQLFSSSTKALNDPSSKKFSYKANSAVMKSIEDEKKKDQQESIKYLKVKFDNMDPNPQKQLKKKKKKKHGGVDISPNDPATTSSNAMNQATNRPPQYGGGGLFSRFFRSSPSSSASNSNTNIASMNNKTGKGNDLQIDSDEWVTIENQPYPLNQNPRMMQGITTNNFTMSPDTSLDKIYDSSFNYDFNMDSLSQMPNSQQQLQNVLRDSNVLAGTADPNTMGYNGVGMNEMDTANIYTNGRIDEREKRMMEQDQESTLMNFGLNVANMITPSSLAEMDLEDTYLLASPKLQNKYHKKKSHKKAPKEIAKAAYDVNLNPSDQQKPIDSQQQQQQPSPSEDIDSLDYKKMEQKNSLLSFLYLLSYTPKYNCE